MVDPEEQPPPSGGPGSDARKGSASEQALELTVQRLAPGYETPTDAQFRSWVQAAAPGVAGELTIRIVAETESRDLNRRYRGLDRPTNVLSFPLDAPPGVPMEVLGDLVICAPLVHREARDQGKSTESHWAHLVVHGVLHLLGHDHAQPEEARRMEALETRILTRLGYGDPYEVPQ